MGEKVDRLTEKVALARVWVPPHKRMKDGRMQDVEGYWREGEAPLPSKPSNSGSTSGSSKEDPKVSKARRRASEGAVGDLTKEGWSSMRGRDGRVSAAEMSKKTGRTSVIFVEDDGDFSVSITRVKGDEPDEPKRFSTLAEAKRYAEAQREAPIRKLKALRDRAFGRKR